LDAFQSTSAQCIQDGSTVVRFSPSTKSTTFRSVGCWSDLVSPVRCVRDLGIFIDGSAPGYLASDLQRVTPQRTSTSALFDYISAGRSTHCSLQKANECYSKFNHWRPHLSSSDCCIGLEQFARVSPVIAIVASFPKQTENRTFCPVLQPWLRTSRCTDYYYVTSLFRLIVTCLCSLMT